MDPPPTEVAAPPEQRRRRRGGASSVELTLIFTFLFVILSLLKLEPLARNSVEVDNNKKSSIDLPQTNQLDSDIVTASASCIDVIESMKPSSRIMWPQGAQQTPEAISEIVKSMVKGDYVEVDSGNDCNQVGSASLAAAIIQRYKKTLCAIHKNVPSGWSLKMKFV